MTTGNGERVGVPEVRLTSPHPVVASAMVHGLIIELLATDDDGLAVRVTEPERRPDYAPDILVHEVAFSGRDADTVALALAARVPGGTR